ncbi:MAG: ribokinase [Thermomicrobiales bacterium]
MGVDFEGDGAARVLVGGAINTDLVATVARAPEAGETITGHGFAIFGGGKGANQAVAAARDGAGVALIGAVGQDDFGVARRADLADDGIDLTFVHTTDEASSGVALITVEEGGENRIAYIPGAVATVTPEAAVAALDAIQPKVVLAPNELPNATLLELFATAMERGVTVMFNAAPDPEQGRGLLPLVDVLIVNEGEGAAIAGMTGEVTIQQVVAALSGLGPSRIALTVGGAGVIGIENGQLFAVHGVKVDVVDTTGAGDTFCGALAASLAEGASFRASVERAVLASALSVTKAGAQASIPTRAEVDVFFETREAQDAVAGITRYDDGWIGSSPSTNPPRP